MRKTKMKTLTSSIAFGLMLCLLLGCSAANAQPLTTIKVNGARLLGPTDFPDIIMLEAKAKMDGNTFVSGSGSIHGIICGATYIFELTDVTIDSESIDITGTIARINMATHEDTHGFYGWIFAVPSVEITANLDGTNMHFILPDLGLDFVGTGQVVI